MTPGRLWWLIRRDVERGPSAAWYDRIVGPMIWRWRSSAVGKPIESAPLHVVLGAEHVTMTAWMLASWTTATNRNWRIILHDDGSLPDDAEPRFRSLGLEVSVLSRRVADLQAAAWRGSHQLCNDYRSRFPLGLKIFDVPTLEKAPRFILIDPDVLFFERPNEILNWADATDDGSCWFNQDVNESSNVPPEEASARLGVKLWLRVNSGVCLLSRNSIDLDFCERILSETHILGGHFWRVEQTLFALCASRASRGGLLPETYEVSLGLRRRTESVSRHYVGAVRHRFWAEGVRETRRRLMLP